MSSGLYSFSATGQRETVRFDVDGRFPQMTVSGTRTTASGVLRSHWVAAVTSSGSGADQTWSGPVGDVWTAGGGTFTAVKVSFRFDGPKLVGTFTAADGTAAERRYTFTSQFFRRVELEYDAVDGVTPPLEYRTHAHPDRPDTLADETITLDAVFERAGFRVIRGGDTVVPTGAAGANGTWSNAELHDAMTDHWSRTPAQQASPGWALWTVFAAEHDDGRSLGGIMFDSNLDSSDPFDYGIERQGTAVFTDSFIAQPPPDDENPDAWVARMRFWTTAHEMGHAFNLLHAWDKGVEEGPLSPWRAGVTPNVNLLSFMNYPFFFGEGPPPSTPDQNTIDFFRRFEFRFSDAELQFLRHAPEPFVQMGNRAFGSDHAFDPGHLPEVPSLRLTVRSNKAAPTYEYLEPVTLELKLENIGKQPLLVPTNVLKDSHHMTVALAKGDGTYRRWVPYSTACYQPAVRVLNPGDAMYEALFVSAGKNGWDLADPGYHAVQVVVEVGRERVLSAPLRVRVLPPTDRGEEVIAQDVFTDAVGRVLTFDGTRRLTEANDTLTELANKYPNRAAAIHARVALGMSGSRRFKEITATDTRRGVRKKVVVLPPTADGMKHLEAVFAKPEQADKAAATLGHVDYSDYASAYSVRNAEQGRTAVADTGWKLQLETLAKRKVLQRVVDAVAARANQPAPESARRPARRRRKK